MAELFKDPIQRWLDSWGTKAQCCHEWQPLYSPGGPVGQHSYTVVEAGRQCVKCGKQEWDAG